MARQIRAVVDTNVLYAGLYSSQGASFRVLSAIEERIVVPILSVTLFLEYEHVLKREKTELGLSDNDVEDFLDGISARAELRSVYYLWRPQLPDAKDDHVLELAVAAGNAMILTHNTRHFGAAQTFGIQIATPADVLGELR